MDYIHQEQIATPNQPHIPLAIRLTFHHWGLVGRQRTDDERWTDMAARVRAAYQTLILQIGGHPAFQIEMVAGDEHARNPMVRMFRNVNGVTGFVLGGFFENILQSDETLELEGLTVVVSLVGQDMQNRGAVGRGRSLGMKLVPPHLKKKGR